MIQVAIDDATWGLALPASDSYVQDVTLHGVVALLNE